MAVVRPSKQKPVRAAFKFFSNQTAEQRDRPHASLAVELAWGCHFEAEPTLFLAPTKREFAVLHRIKLH
jgi:hypothetical protein